MIIQLHLQEMEHKLTLSQIVKQKGHFVFLLWKETAEKLFLKEIGKTKFGDVFKADKMSVI